MENVNVCHVFFLRDWFVVYVKCAFDHAFPENVTASVLRHGVKVSKTKRVWKACILAGLANVRKTKRDVLTLLAC